MNLAVLATVFGVIFVAELPDKTALASLVLGTRYRARYVFAGVAAAFTVHVVLAVSAGSLLFLLPHRVMQAVVAAFFAAGAVLMVRRRDDDAPGEDGQDEEARDGARSSGGDSPALDESGRGGVATLARPAAIAPTGFWTVAVRSFVVLFIAEFGDLTQLAMANLAARYHDPVTVGVGAVMGLWAVGALAIIGGRELLRVVPFRWITRTAAVVMGVLAAVSLVTAING